jgi:hypothetical protein
MGLVRREPRKRIRLAQAAKMIGCSTDTLLRWGIFKVFKLNPDNKTSPWMVFEAEIHAYIAKTER